MLFLPFGKPAAEADVADLYSLIKQQIVEGEFVEYKRDWEPRKVARAVCSFANSRAGGTVIVGVKADKLVPVEVAGAEHRGDLAESATAAVRSLIAPIPSVRPFVIPLENGRPCLAIEVPPGTQPPYIFVPRGQILIRTPTSSEPITISDRDELDRLFAQGQRAKEWARGRLHEAVEGLDAEPHVMGIATVPVADEGLPCEPIIFRRSFLERLMPTFPTWMLGIPERKLSTGQDVATVGHLLIEYPDAVDIPIPRASVSRQAFRDGTVVTKWQNWQEDNGYEQMQMLIRELPEQHRHVVQDLLGHLGPVVFGIRGRWRNFDGSISSLRITRGPLPVEDLGSQALHDSLTREMGRALHGLEFEPEPEDL